MNEVYNTIYGYGEDEYIVNKSRFIGYAMPIKSEEEALEFIETISKKHYDATHNVHAYVFGEDSNIQRFNDDGEPSGTAGIPALEILKKENLRNVVVVVTRYFGGVKLGAGGLIRAYAKGAKIGVEAGKIIQMCLHQYVEFEVEYDQYGKIENYLFTENLPTEEIEFLEKVKIKLYVKNSDYDSFNKDITDLTSGDAKIYVLGEKHLPVYNGKRLPMKE